MSDRNHALALFKIAQRDFKAAKAMLDPETFEDPVFGFQIQQTVEKLFKAWLSLKGVVYTKTHDLESLAEMLEETGVQLPEEIQNALPDITIYAVAMDI
jgi:HEPN domain-containing protein